MAAGSSPIVTFSKDPLSVLDYTIDWGSWLKGDQILTSAWTIPAGVTQSGTTYSSSTATIWINGGTAGTGYSIYNQITTVGGRTEKRTIKINVIDR